MPPGPGPHAHPSFSCVPPSSALLFPRPSSSLFVAFAAPSAVFSLHFPSSSPSDSIYPTSAFVCACSLRLSPPTPDSDLSSQSLVSAPPAACVCCPHCDPRNRDLDLFDLLLPIQLTLAYPNCPPDIIDRCRPNADCLATWSPPPLAILNPRKWSTAILGVDSPSDSLFPSPTA